MTKTSAVILDSANGLILQLIFVLFWGRRYISTFALDLPLSPPIMASYIHVQWQYFLLLFICNHTIQFCLWTHNQTQNSLPCNKQATQQWNYTKGRIRKENRWENICLWPCISLYDAKLINILLLSNVYIVTSYDILIIHILIWTIWVCKWYDSVVYWSSCMTAGKTRFLQWIM